jgi:hypothetical protein
MVTAQQIITDTERLLATKVKTLEALCPDNYRTAEFMDDAEAAVRKTIIVMLKDNIRELRCLLAALKAL